MPALPKISRAPQVIAKNEGAPRINSTQPNLTPRSSVEGGKSLPQLPPHPPTPTLKHQPRKHAPDHRPRREPDPVPEPAPALRIEEVREGQVRLRLVQPVGELVREGGAEGGRGDGRDLHEPVGLAVEVAGVEGKAVALEGEGVVRGLVGVEVCGEEVGGLLEVV